MLNYKAKHRLIDMQEILENYIKSISSKFSHKETSEMGYRTDFENLLKRIFEPIKDTHIFHDSKAIEGNKPDFVVLKDKIPLLYIEAKDIGTSLDKIEKSEQMSRYFGYTNLVLTDYLEFRFYRNGLRYGESIQIASYDIKNRTITPAPENYKFVSKTLLDFAQSHKEPIRSGKHLSKIMGGKAQRIRDNVRQFLATESEKNAELTRVYETIKNLLVHDLTKESFADMYAQTLVYGLFAARYHDDSPETFSRQEARDLIPNSNPLLRHFFDHIVGPNFDKRLEYIVNELCEVFSHADVVQLMQEYFKNGSKEKAQKGTDPVIHFYEDFLKEYDPNLRKRMGAYYTPLPVVQFIVRSIDYLLKKEFNLAAGLADTSKTGKGLHKVQVLDPATGTGTFISSVIGVIYEKLIKDGQKGRWPSYVHNELLPRVYGFELMMAPYTIAHLKLGIAFKKTGFWDFHRRLGIYLTNSLEESSKQQQMFSFGLAESIAEESKEASIIKNEKAIMVVLGNPPYSVSSSNKGTWITDQIKVYKEDLNERNIQPLSDDYIKFIRFAEHFIEKNGSGIVAMITNNSFLDGIIHRQMRKHLLQTFDKIYILDLHGNSKKKEKAPDGGKDENVFDIQQGVSISIFVRKEGKKGGLGKVHHTDVHGIREEKFKILNEAAIQTIKWKKLNYSEPYYFFVPKEFSKILDYQKGIKIDSLMTIHNSGVVTSNDGFTIDESKDMLWGRVNKLGTSNLEEATVLFSSVKDSNDWKLKNARADIIASGINKDLIRKINYRPFDTRYTYYTGRSNGFHGRPRFKSMKHMLHNNLGLLLKKQHKRDVFSYVFVSNLIVEGCVFESAYARNSIFPLYSYSGDGSKTPNLNKEIVDEIEEVVGNTKPEDIFDYIYAVLHSPNYREKYKEFLKIDFPRVPYPRDKKNFKKLVKLGAELRSLHLLEPTKLNKFIITYPEDGDSIVEKVEYKDGKVFINAKQYFGKVPEVAWNFWIGGYQPAQKWLKDRKSRTLTNEDIEHYQKIIVALTETGRLVKDIDKVRI